MDLKDLISFSFLKHQLPSFTLKQKSINEHKFTNKFSLIAYLTIRIKGLGNHLKLLANNFQAFTNK
jgi:hypothetical protein